MGTYATKKRPWLVFATGKRDGVVLEIQAYETEQLAREAVQRLKARINLSHENYTYCEGWKE